MKWGELRRPEADGGIAQLVEHYAGSVRVRSSSLLASTNKRSFLRSPKSAYARMFSTRAYAVRIACY
jgi:hypothetical protein